MMATETPLSDVRFLTVAEVATIMRVSKMTVYRLGPSGGAWGLRGGGCFRVAVPGGERCPSVGWSQPASWKPYESVVLSGSLSRRLTSTCGQPSSAPSERTYWLLRAADRSRAQHPGTVL